MVDWESLCGSRGLGCQEGHVAIDDNKSYFVEQESATFILPQWRATRFSALAINAGDQ